MDEELTQLVVDHMGVADTVAVAVYNTAKHALELDELKSIAYLGLVAAAKRWRPYCEEHGYSDQDTQYFRTFASRRIRGAIYDEFRAADWASRTLRSRSKMLREAGQESGATVEEMAATTGLSADVVRSTMHGMSRRPVSLEGSDIDISGVEEDVESSVFARRVTAGMLAEFEKLSPLAKIIVVLKYHQGLNMREIATELSLATVKVSQIHQAAVIALHGAMLVVAEDTTDATV